MVDVDFVHKMFAKYYADNAGEITPPSSIDQREFGFLLFWEKMMIRHKSFITVEDLQRFIISTAPSDVYYSSTHYQHPEQPMEKKGWIGADLVFDIDSDHIETPCKRAHDYWVCENCYGSGRGSKPDKCPSCGGVKFKMESWLCESCLEAAKVETQKLLDFLIADFGFPPEKVITCFSGQRGYHVHIEENEVLDLDQNARKEIVDYVMGTGLNFELQGLFETKDSSKRLIIRPDLHDPGWRGRTARGIYDFLAASTPDTLKEIEGLPTTVVKILQENRDKVFESLTGEAQWMAVKGISLKTWIRLAERGIAKQASAVDTVVTTDIHRLIRLPQTLHGKTGLKAMEIPHGTFEKFDPLREAVAFKGILTVLVRDAHHFRIDQQSYGPYKQEKVTLPAAAAMYLICKGAASPA